MDKDWRRFEQLVALIEEALGPSGVIVKSPDRIPEIATGNLREVDASIRYTVGSVPVLLTIECRDRLKVEDITWIEQLATKRDRIGAAKTIAVSSRGFSEPAIISARQYGIEVRTLSEITAQDITAWCQLDCLRFVPPSIRICELHFFDETGRPIQTEEINPGVLESIRRDNVWAPIVRAPAGMVTANDMVAAFQKAYAGTEADLNWGVQFGAESKKRTAVCLLDPGTHWLLLENGEISLSRVDLLVEVKLEMQMVIANRTYRYQSPDGTVVDGVEFIVPKLVSGTAKPMRILLQNGPSFGFKATFAMFDDPELDESVQ